MNKLTLLALTVVALATSYATALAVETGLYDPYLREVNEDVRYAMWDNFTETYSSGTGAGTVYTYSGSASSASTLTGLSLVQSSAHINVTTGSNAAQGAGLLNGNDVYYSSTRAQSWTLTAQSSIDINTMSFQVKTANVGTAANPGAIVESVFLPTLNGFGAASYVRSTPVSGEKLQGFDVFVIEYRWDNIDIAANTAFTINFSLAGGNTGQYTRKPIDFVALDAVPEPSTYALMALGLVVIVWRGRRTLKRI